jgi:hypothetical protein
MQDRCKVVVDQGGDSAGLGVEEEVACIWMSG